MSRRKATVPGGPPCVHARWEGDRAVRVTWQDVGEGDATSALVGSLSLGASLARALAEAFLPDPAVLDVVLSLRAVTVLLRADADDAAAQTLRARVAAVARTAAARLAVEPPDAPDATGVLGATMRPAPLHTIPVRYGGEDGPDLEAVASLCGLSPEDVVRAHTAPQYRCFAVGFRPGMPFLAPVPTAIAAPRLDQPRLTVPAGSVAIAGRQTGIYPVASSGGWRLLGRTDRVLFDPTAPDVETACLIHPGDRVQFVADPASRVKPA